MHERDAHEISPENVFVTFPTFGFGLKVVMKYTTVDIQKKHFDLPSETCKH